MTLRNNRVDEVDTRRTFVFDQDESIRLDKFLTIHLLDLSRSQVQRLIGIGMISIAGEAITKNGFVLEKPNTVIDVLIPAPEPIIFDLKRWILTSSSKMKM